MTKDAAKIHNAIISAQQEIHTVGVGKNQRNDAQNYAYRGAADVVMALAPILDKLKIYIEPKVTDVQFETFTAEYTDKWNNPKLKITRFCQVRVDYRLICAEDGSFIQTSSAGEGFDMSDKALNKARTAALKYMLTETFLIPEQGVDSEIDHIEIEQDAPAKAPKPAKVTKPELSEKAKASITSAKQWKDAFDAASTLQQLNDEMLNAKPDIDIIRQNHEPSYMALRAAYATNKERLENE